MEIIVRDADPAEFEVIGEIAVEAYRTIDPDLGGYEERRGGQGVVLSNWEI